MYQSPRIWGNTAGGDIAIALLESLKAAHSDDQSERLGEVLRYSQPRKVHYLSRLRPYSIFEGSPCSIVVLNARRDGVRCFCAITILMRSTDFSGQVRRSVSCAMVGTRALTRSQTEAEILVFQSMVDEKKFVR